MHNIDAFKGGVDLEIEYHYCQHTKINIIFRRVLKIAKSDY